MALQTEVRFFCLCRGQEGRKRLSFHSRWIKKGLIVFLIYFRAVTAPNPLIIVALWCCLAFQTFREVKRPPLWYCVSSSSRCARNIFASALVSFIHLLIKHFSSLACVYAFNLLFLINLLYSKAFKILPTSRSFNTTYKLLGWRKISLEVSAFRFTANFLESDIVQVSCESAASCGRNEFS